MEEFHGRPRPEPSHHALEETHLVVPQRQSGLDPVVQAAGVVGDVGVTQLSQLISRDT